jgi:ectoine hydroxylase-related dioxygenase (phytanoyl-CoA dioxygenase family)
MTSSKSENFTSLQEDFESLAQQSARIVEEFPIPHVHTERYRAFKNQYAYEPDAFFEQVGSVETGVLERFCQGTPCFNYEKLGENYLSCEEIESFKSGHILKKRADNREAIQAVMQDIHRILNTQSPLARGKHLHFLSPQVLSFIYFHRKVFFQPLESLFNTNQGISFEFGYFRTPPGARNIHWHDDYTIFKNDSRLSSHGALILNCHIALSPVTSQSSPLCFMHGTPNIVYARSALKFFAGTPPFFDQELLLKATYLGEALYTPGEKIKTNFLGLLPNYVYRLDQVQKGNVKFSVFFETAQPGDFLIFSPNYMHASPYQNTESSPRESMVLRCFAEETYNYRNVMRMEDFREMVSFALGTEVSVGQIKHALWGDHPEVSSATYLNSSVYLHKNDGASSDSPPRIYLEDLYHAYQNKFRAS